MLCPLYCITSEGTYCLVVSVFVMLALISSLGAISIAYCSSLLTGLPTCPCSDTVRDITHGGTEWWGWLGNFADLAGLSWQFFWAQLGLTH